MCSDIDCIEIDLLFINYLRFIVRYFNCEKIWCLKLCKDKYLAIDKSWFVEGAYTILWIIKSSESYFNGHLVQIVNIHFECCYNFKSDLLC